MKSVAAFALLAMATQLLAGPTTGPTTQSAELAARLGPDGAGFLILSIEGIPEAGIAAMKLETHAAMIRSTGVIRNLVEENAKFRDTVFFKSIQAREGNAVEEVLKVLEVRAISGTLLVRVDVDREIVGADSRSLIRFIGDAYLASLERVRIDTMSNELEVVKQWRDRYNRELARLGERMKVLLSAAPADGDVADATARADAVDSIKQERSHYRELQWQSDERVAYLQHQLRTAQVELRWISMPTH